MQDEKSEATRGPETDMTEQQLMDDAYGEELLKCMDIIERNDFYGIVADNGLRFFAEKLNLTPHSHALDLCCGIGGPARFLATTFGCKVTGIDLSAFNHQIAQQRTAKAGLSERVEFIHGDAMNISFPDETFSHVFGCEGWCYFADKLPLYKTIYRVLKPNGIIAFLESACDTPVRLQVEEFLGPVYYDSVGEYRSMLRTAGFDQIQQFDTTRLASQDVAGAMYRLINKKAQIVAAAGAETYYALLEIWAEFFSNFSEGRLTHCGFIARK